MGTKHIIGSVFIVTSTAVGAGMLALPLLTAGMGFPYAVLLMFGMWFISLISALLTLEANLAFKPPHNSYNTMSAVLLGPIGKVITWFSFLCLLYALLSAYMTAGSSLINMGFEAFLGIDLPLWAGASLFGFTLGGFVYWSTSAVDMVNRGLFTLKLVVFGIAITLLTPHIDVTRLEPFPGQIYLLAAIPIAITAFGFQVIIPSIVQYQAGNTNTLRLIIILGSVIPLTLYIIWLAASLGSLPRFGAGSFEEIIRQQGQVGELTLRLSQISDHNWLIFSVNSFAHIAVATSFLGVSLSLFDFVRDCLPDSITRTRGRVLAAFLTFLPPFLFALFFPQGFSLALGYASIFVALICIILPALMVLVLRYRQTTLKSDYRVMGGIFLPLLMIAAGIAIIVLQLLQQFNLLPIFGQS